jgi:hypothetical protein
MKFQTRTSRGDGHRGRLKVPLGLLGTLTALFSVLALLGSSAAMADEDDNGCKDPTGPPTSNLVAASFSVSGKDATYKFESVDAGSAEGVPGLIKYCVFPSPNGANTLPSSVVVDTTPGTGAQGWDGTFFNDPAQLSAFSFDRNTGNGSNIPFDGTTRTMGTATWSGGAPSEQAIVLHINDEDECNALGENSETCWVLPGEIEEEEPPAADLTATKDAHPSLTRTYKWEIEKDVDKTRAEIAEGKAKFNYTVTVKHDEGTDSGWLVTGEIEVNNPNSGDVTGVDIEDSINDLGASCEVTGGSNATIPANSSEAFPYECTYSAEPGSPSETNTAIVSWDEQTVDGQLLDEGEAEAEAAVEWGEAELNVVDGSIEVEDSLHGFLGTVYYTDPSPETFEYSEEFEGVPGTCTEYNNEATFITSDLGEEGSASKDVEVCVGADLEVEKSATPAFKRTFEWDIEKEVDKTKVEIAEGGTATFNYTVMVTHNHGTDSDWVVTGKIKVTNPNDWQAIEVDVTDEIESDTGAKCLVSGGEDVEIPASGSEEFDYECTYEEAPASDEQTNRATATWDAKAASTPNGSASGTAAVDWTSVEPELVDESIEVSDTLGGPLGTVYSTDLSPTTFEYPYEFEGDPAGTCTEHNNTATFTTGDTESTGEASQAVEVCVGANLEVKKTASSAFTRKFSWTVGKKVDKTKVTSSGGTATFKYTITFTKGAGIDSAWVVKGTITVSNPNDWQAITADVEDAINDTGATCGVTGGGDAEIPAGGSEEFDYECTYSAAPESKKETNTATATWDAVAASTPSGSAEGTAGIDWGATVPTETDECIETTDTVDGVPTQLDKKLCESKTYETKLTFPVGSGCVAHNNTAAFKTLDTGTTGSASQKVEVCGPLETGARTIGFWHNKNGQKIITDGSSTSKVCNSGTWLRQFNPFKDLSATATCKDVAAYFTKIFTAADSSGSSMNPMLKAQMLATALNVYFTDPALGGNKLGGPSPLGGVKIDLTKVSGAFGGATSMTVNEMLAYAAGKSNSGGSVWYGQVKATQELAKNIFDDINNEVAFGA